MRTMTRIGVLAGVATLGIAAAGVAGVGDAVERRAERGVLAHETEGERPSVIAVKFHAEWCGKCKAMGPVFKELQAKYDQLPVLYEVFDHTREFDRRQSAYLAHAMDLDGLWDEHGGSTGFVLLIDAQNREVIKRLSHEDGLAEMGAALQKAVREAS